MANDNVENILDFSVSWASVTLDWETEDLLTRFELGFELGSWT